MTKVYLSPEDSALLRSHLNRVTPFSADAQELLARVATNDSYKDLARDALGLLEREGYAGVEIIEGTIYLGLPSFVSQALIEALAEIASRLSPEKRKMLRSTESQVDVPIVYVAVPKGQHPSCSLH